MQAFNSKKRSMFALAALLVLALYSIKDLSISRASPSANENYAVQVDYFGMDAEKIEKLVAIPLEEKIASLDNLLQFSTSCENSKCVASVSFCKSKAGSYMALSQAVDKLRQELPSDAQRPKIFANSAESKWIFTAAFDSKKHSREEIEKKLAAQMQKIPGVSQAFFCGGETEEIQLAFDDKRLSFRNEAPWTLAALLQEQNASALFGENMAYRNRAKSAGDINQDKRLFALAQAKSGFRKKDTIARINGAECVLLCLKSSSESQNISVSKAARKCLKKAFPGKAEYTITYDNGNEQERLLLRLLSAFLQSLAALALAVWLFYRSVKTAAAILAWTGLVLLFSLAAISFLKIPLDSSTISGFTISLGLICDAALYLADDCQPSLGAMAISTLTTICALLPLCALDPIAPGIKNLSLACALTIGMSALLSLFFLPFFRGVAGVKKARNCLNLYLLSYNKPRNILKLSTFIYILTPLIFFLSPKNLAKSDESLALRAQIEWPPERRADLIDQELCSLTEKLLETPGVLLVQSQARRGSAELELAAKSARQKKKAAARLLELSKNLSGNLYLPLQAKKSRGFQQARICLLGDDAALCQRLSKAAARTVMESPFFLRSKAQAAFHFKDDEKILVARPKKEFLAQNGLAVKDLALFFRWNLFGAVAKKLYSDDSIMDIRAGQKNFAFGPAPTLEEFSTIKLKGLSFAALCDVAAESRPEKIFRKNGRRAAAFTVEAETKKSDLFFKELKAALGKINLPEGYFFEWPADYENLRLDCLKIFAAFALAFLCVFILIAAHCERPADALKAAMTIPISVFPPLALRAISFSPIKLGDAAAMVFISGICVNNALYIMSEWNLKGRKDAHAAARSVSKSVMSASATTIAGALPLMCWGAGSFAGNLAFFMFFGTLGSLAAAFIFFPALLSLALGNDQVKQNADNCGKRDSAKGELEFSDHELQDAAADSNHHDD